MSFSLITVSRGRVVQRIQGTESRSLLLSKCVSTSDHTSERTFTIAMYGALYQCDSGYAGFGVKLEY